MAANPDRKPSRRTWHVYMVRTVDGHLYTGVATDVARRFGEHVSGGPRCAKYLRAHPAHQLAFTRPVGTRSRALRVEYRIKQLTKANKEKLVATRRIPAVVLRGR